MANNKPCQNRECPGAYFTKSKCCNCFMLDQEDLHMCKHYNPIPPPKPLKKPDLDKWYEDKSTGRHCKIMVYNPDRNSYRLDGLWFELYDFLERFEEVKK